MTDGLTASDVAVLTGNNGRNNDGAFGGDWGAWIILFLIFGLFGWGGFGGFGGGFGGNGGSAATQADIQRGFDTQAIVTKLDGITQGICSLGYDQLAQMNGINQNVSQTGFAIQSAISGMAAQNQACCCETQRLIERGFADTNYNLATNTCALQNTMNTNTRDILENQNSNTRAILDYLCQDKISTLQAENQSLKLAASQSAQNAYLTATMDSNTAELIRRINPSPVPAYTVPAPYPYAGYGCNGGCNC